MNWGGRTGLAWCGAPCPRPVTRRTLRGGRRQVTVHCTRPAGHHGPHQYVEWGGPPTVVWADAGVVVHHPDLTVMGGGRG